MTSPDSPEVASQRSARRLTVMLDHSSHLLFGALWLVGMVRAGRSVPQLATGLALAVVYLAGLWWRNRQRGSSGGFRTVGRLWVGSLTALWAVLAALGSGWAWLCFPLFFLLLFVLPTPAGFGAVLVTALWAGLAPLARRQPVHLAGVLGPVLGAVVAVIFWVILRQLRSDVAVQRQLVAQVQQAQQGLVASARREAQAQERERLARDLHDTLAQGLNSIVVLSRSLAQRHPWLAEELAVVEQTARDNLGQARGMVRTMGQPDAGEDGPTDELRSLVAHMQRREEVIGSGLDISLVVAGDEGQVAAPVAEAAVMAARSLLANVAQHARATRCQLTVSWFTDELVLDVVDDGVGFHRAATTSGFGLDALAARVAELGGHLDLESEPGSGTSVAVHLPRRPRGVTR